MKRNKKRKSFSVRKQGGVGRWFRKKPRPIKLSRRYRKAKAFAAANRRAWLGLAISLAVAVALFAMVMSVPPRIFPEQLAASVKAQRVHDQARGLQTLGSTPAATDLALKVPKSAESTEPVVPNKLAGPRHRLQYLPISFEELAGFRFLVTDQVFEAKHDSVTASRMTLEQIPKAVKALSEREVSLRGFMLPMQYEGKLATEFLLMRNQGLCCYGIPPKITEWVNVRVAGKGVKPVMDRPVTVCGTFHVGDVREHGELVGIYQLDADKLKGTEE